MSFGRLAEDEIGCRLQTKEPPQHLLLRTFASQLLGPPPGRAGGGLEGEGRGDHRRRAAVGGEVVVGPVREEKRVPMTRLRARIAERLLEATRNTAMLTTFNEVNMAPVMALLPSASATTAVSTWRRLWVALAEAEAELGLPITPKQLAELRARVDDV